MKTNAEWLDELLTRQERKRFISKTGIKDPELFVETCKSAVLDITRDVIVKVLEKENK